MTRRKIYNILEEVSDRDLYRTIMLAVFIAIMAIILWKLSLLHYMIGIFFYAFSLTAWYHIGLVGCSKIKHDAIEEAIQQAAAEGYKLGRENHDEKA